MKCRSALLLEKQLGRRTLLAELVQEAGFLQVIEASSAVNALECMERISFDMVFVEVSGVRDPNFKLVRSIRQDRTGNFRVPIVIVSTLTVRGIVEQARDVGASGFLLRPFSRGLLQLQIARGLRDARPFIEAETFVGPDRRRWNDPDFPGPDRRTNFAFI